MGVLASLAAGVIFGLGLVISGMADPAKIKNFLDLAGTWDPSLAFVMAGAVFVAFAGYRLLKPRARPLFAERFYWPTARDIDAPLVGGAALFGIGWGLSGFCPGPALVALPLLAQGTLVFVPGMLVGMLAARTVSARRQTAVVKDRGVEHARASGAAAGTEGRVGVMFQRSRPEGMIFRQMFDSTSGTYTYLLASRRGGEALIVDPVLEKVDRYIQLLRELDLKLVKAVDTHLHADHITGLGALRDRTHCITVMGEKSGVDVVSMRVADGDKLSVDGVSLDVIYTPGHTDDSYSFRLPDRVFTGDTLLIRGTGRTDFQNGDARAQYDSIFNRLLKLPDQTLIYPAHDYKGDTVSTIGEEKAFNPRLQVKSVAEYVDLMHSLKLPNPKMMDVAVPANMRVGMAQEEIARRGWALSAAEAEKLVDQPGVALIDLRERGEREKHGTIAGSVHAPYPDLEENIRPGGMLHELATSGKRLVFYCAFGERSAMAVQAAQDAGLRTACHVQGGLDAWKKVHGPLAK